jgi:hypothetical protein
MREFVRCFPTCRTSVPAANQPSNREERRVHAAKSLSPKDHVDVGERLQGSIFDRRAPAGSW